MLIDSAYYYADSISPNTKNSKDENHTSSTSCNSYQESFLGKFYSAEIKSDSEGTNRKQYILSYTPYGFYESAKSNSTKDKKTTIRERFKPVTIDQKTKLPVYFEELPEYTDFISPEFMKHIEEESKSLDKKYTDLFNWFNQPENVQFTQYWIETNYETAGQNEDCYISYTVMKLKQSDFKSLIETYIKGYTK